MTDVTVVWFAFWIKHLLLILRLIFVSFYKLLIMSLQNLPLIGIVAWLNFVVLILSSFLSVCFYIKSVSPAQLERRIGETVYRKCGQFRIISCLFMTVIVANYVLYYFFPLPIPIPHHFI